MGFPELIYSLLPFGTENACYKYALFLVRAITSPSLPSCKLETDALPQYGGLGKLRLPHRGQVAPAEIDKDTSAMLKPPVPGCKAWGAECCLCFSSFGPLLGPWAVRDSYSGMQHPAPTTPAFLPAVRFLLNIGLHLEFLSLTRPVVLILLFDHQPLGNLKKES